MTQSEIQQLIEVVRAETQKGGNTKERIANLLTELNDAKMQRDGSNLTPEDITALQTILGSGGITSVETDTTLKGNGSESTPLGLSDDTFELINGKTTMTAVETYVTGLNYATESYVNSNYVNLNNLITSWGTPTNSQIPSAKLVKDTIDEQIIKTINSNATIDDTYHNSIVRITANVNITIPNTLRSDFNAVFDVIGNFTATFVEGGTSTFSAPFGKILKDNSMCTLYKQSTTSFRLNGGLLPA